jgi:hypothetical protein
MKKKRFSLLLISYCMYVIIIDIYARLENIILKFSYLSIKNETIFRIRMAIRIIFSRFLLNLTHNITFVFRY